MYVCMCVELVRVYKLTNKHTYIRTLKHVICACMYVYISCMHTHTNTPFHLPYIHTHIHIYMHAQTHIHMFDYIPRMVMHGFAYAWLCMVLHDVTHKS
jgi:hypothetical protein